MKYTIYKVTNTLNGKIYIGKHQTKDLNDGYMGSGKYLKRAIQKHGIENFIKEILYIFNTEAEMNAREAELVSEEFCLREDTYNICVGGHGGFSYVNSIKTPEDRHIAGMAGGFANPTEYVIERRKEGSRVGWENGLKRWKTKNKAITQPGLQVMQSEAANIKRKETMKGIVSVYDKLTNKIVRFNALTRAEYDSNRERYIGIRSAKKQGLI